MVINGVINDNLATMSFNEHNYVVKRVSMSFPTLYYLGLEPIFGDYIEENDTLVVAGKLSKRDILKKEETIYYGVTITKDDEYINIGDIKENTKYLKNIDVKTGKCFSRLYIEGGVRRLKKGVYSYRKDNSIVLVTPNLDKENFNIFDFKEKLVEMFSLICFSEMKDDINVISVNYNKLRNYFETIIKFGEIDTIHLTFILNNKNNIELSSFVYSENFHNVYKLKEDNSLISFDSFPNFFSNCELMIYLKELFNDFQINRNKNFDRARIYVNMGVTG